MTPEERQLISDLFDRMRSYGAPEKDREAEDLINRSARANPDAAYLLVQSVLVQEQALQQADERIRDLEDRLRQLEPPQQQRASGSFLGGIFGGRQEPPRAGSVPTIGSRAQPSSPWGQQPGQPMGQPMQAPMQQAAGGGFMRTALSAAAGVAGGMLLADGIRSMMGGGSAHAASPGFGGGQPGSGDSDAGYSRDHGYTDASDNDPGASYSDGNDPGFDSGDLDI
ncbi:MAG: DUF2076 domain-containing protein [Hyphomicrobiaceae bacterium]|nr:DUF2076 domain-containing protein [Hyphomicrobiaceae bacterium]